MEPSLNVYERGVELSPGCQVAFSTLSHVRIAPGCRIHHCLIQGTPEAPIEIKQGAELSHCQIISTPSNASFRFGYQEIQATPVVIEEDAVLHDVRVENSFIGARVKGTRCQVLNSVVDHDCTLRCHANLTLTYAAPHCSLGSEVSKSIITGKGFVSEHTASYLSLVAPDAFPILDAAGNEVLLEGLPNLTNIGAGTVFANYSGKPKPAASLEASSGSQKGTALLYCSFTGVNSVIVNRYGQPSADQSPFDLLRRRDLTILGFGSFVEKKCTGRIPAFSYAGATSARQTRIGWVLAHQPGIIHNFLKKMRKLLGEDAGRLQDLVDGTIRLECRLLEEQKASSSPLWTHEQIEEGLTIFQENLDGRWAMDDKGILTTPWHFDQTHQRWTPAS